MHGNLFLFFSWNFFSPSIYCCECSEKNKKEVVKLCSKIGGPGSLDCVCVLYNDDCNYSSVQINSCLSHGGPQSTQ